MQGKREQVRGKRFCGLQPKRMSNKPGLRTTLLFNFSFLIFLFIFFTFYLLPFNLFAENEFSLRIAAGIKAPLGLELINTGMSAEASLDWAFWNFARGFDAGISAEGGFTSLPVQSGGPLAMLEGKAGPFVRWRPFERWAFHAGLNAGVYNHSREGDSNTSGLIGGALGAQFHLSPFFSLFAEGGYT